MCNKVGNHNSLYVFQLQNTKYTMEDPAKSAEGPGSAPPPVLNQPSPATYPPTTGPPAYQSAPGAYPQPGATPGQPYPQPGVPGQPYPQPGAVGYVQPGTVMMQPGVIQQPGVPMQPMQPVVVGQPGFNNPMGEFILNPSHKFMLLSLSENLWHEVKLLKGLFSSFEAKMKTS